MASRKRHKIVSTHSFLPSGLLRKISCSLSPSIPSHKHSAESQSRDNAEKYRDIESWIRKSINCTQSEVFLLTLSIMALAAEASSTKSSLVSGKAASLKKTVQKGAKAITRPFKKLKQSFSSSSRSSRSHSTMTLPLSDNEPSNTSDKSGSERGSVDGNESEPEVELTPEQELGAYLLLSSLFHCIHISFRRAQNNLALPYLFIFQTRCHPSVS
jgi:hypothetical protein